MIKYLIIIAYTTLLYSFTKANGTQFNFGHIDYSQGLSNNRVLCFAEDNNGFMWIGTTSGLNRFDGYDIKEFMHNPADPYSIPDNMIQRIVKDKLGRLWISTPKGLTIFNPTTEKFSSQIRFLINSNIINLQDIDLVINAGDSNLIFRVPNMGIIVHNIITNQNQLIKPLSEQNNVVGNSEITSIVYSNNLIYAVYRNGIITVIDLKSKSLKRKIDLHKSYFEDTDQLYQLFMDHNNDIWVFSSDGSSGIVRIKDNKVLSFDEESKPALNSNIISSIMQDDENNYWIGTDHGGINILDSDLNKISYIQYNETNKNGLSQNVITNLFKSKNGIIWIGTYKQGVNYYHKSLFRFSHYNRQANNQNSLNSNDVNCFAEDKNGNLWIGTNGNGLIYFDRGKNLFKEVASKQNNENGLKSNVIVSLTIDKTDKLWIGTYHGGLSVFDGTNFTTYLNNPDDNKTISDNRIWDIFEDTKGNLWIGTLGGGLELFDRKQNIFRHFNGEGLNTINTNFIIDITEDKDGDLWFGTDFGVYSYEYESSRFKHYYNMSDDELSISDDFVSAVYTDSKNNIWIGTRDGLNLFDKKNQKFIKFNISNGLPDNSIMAILESNEGNIWLSTTEGLCKLIVNYNSNGEYQNHHTVNFNESDGLQGREFNEGSALKTRKGELIFGGANGFNLFKPDIEVPRHSPLKINIIGLEIFGKEVDINPDENNRTIIENSILNNETIKLSFKENIFSLKFVTIDYLGGKKIHYRYKLEGFNDQWIKTSWQDRKATFTNLNPGKYTFKVQSTDYNTNWIDCESSLNIIIQPPWYRTWLAYSIYFSFIFILIILSRRVVILKERSKFKEEQASKESKRQQELNALKTRFFTNISHEFRTPLTLILTPLEKLIKTNADANTQKHLTLMYQNSKRLLNLVNQLLDFRKIEENKLKVNYIYGNIIGFITYITESFADFRDSKNIELDFLPDEKELFMQFDKDKLEKIIFNLLSNAFKFTPEKGYIRIFTEVETISQTEYLKIIVKDNGIGINKDQQMKIFERFYQSDLPNEFITKGSGIGLSLTQDFVELLNGTISVKSEPGKGSQFTVLLPINRNLPQSVSEEIEETKEIDTIEPKPLIIKEKHEKDRKTIMLVEDNEDFRYYVKDSLMAKFNVIESENGKIALEHLKSKQPDLIVSDVMMPEMDGLSLCNEIKTNPSFSHIPIILLTAKSTQQDKLDGLKQGADEYITKPFSFDILEARIDYLLTQRQKFILHYQKSFQVEANDSSITPIDEKLLKKTHELINENISNSEFSVEKLSKELGMSRVYLYKKVSSLTGKTPVELIRLVRLKKSAELLMNSNLTISEVAYEVGFTDPRYFSKQFKIEFDVLPSKFKENQGL